MSLTNSEIEEREVLRDTIQIVCSHLDINNKPALIEENDLHRCDICRKTEYNPAIFFKNHKEKLFLRLRQLHNLNKEEPLPIEILQEVTIMQDYANKLCNHLGMDGKEDKHYIGDLLEICNCCNSIKRRSQK